MTTPITVVGNLTGDPELRFTPSGHAVANFTVAKNRRHFDRQKNEWVDDDTDFYRCAIWRDAAEHVAESLARGMEVVVTGSLQSREYEARDGSGKRTSWEIQVDHVGPSLRGATAKVTRVQRGGRQGDGGFPADDPWATQEPPATSEAPF